MRNCNIFAEWNKEIECRYRRSNRDFGIFCTIPNIVMAKARELST